MEIFVHVDVRQEGRLVAAEDSASLILEDQDREDIIVSRTNEVACRITDRLNNYDLFFKGLEEDKAKRVAEETQILDKKGESDGA